MKSFILCFLLLSTTLSLVPFVAFSRCFTSDNPILLPTTTHNNNALILPAVLDKDGLPLKIGVEYIIQNTFVGGGAVFWGYIGLHICPNAVLQRRAVPGLMGPGTPVKFVLKVNDDDVVREMYAINIMFSINPSSPCAKETVWKVDDKEFVVTNGTLGNENNFFKITKYGVKEVGLKNAYKLMHCPPQSICKDITTTLSGYEYPRLVAVDNGFLPFVFVKAAKA